MTASNCGLHLTFAQREIFVESSAIVGIIVFRLISTLAFFPRHFIAIDLALTIVEMEYLASKPEGIRGEELHESMGFGSFSGNSSRERHASTCCLSLPVASVAHFLLLSIIPASLKSVPAVGLVSESFAPANNFGFVFGV